MNKLTDREFVGEIVEVLDKPGYYKVKIPELAYYSYNINDGIIVYDESSKVRYTSSRYGTYGWFYPLQVGTKVVIRFKKDNINSGVIDRILAYDYPSSSIKHPNYYLITKTLGETSIYVDDDSSVTEIKHYSGTGDIKITPNNIDTFSNGQIINRAVNNFTVLSPKIYLKGGTSVSSVSPAQKTPLQTKTYPINDPDYINALNVYEKVSGINSPIKTEKKSIGNKYEKEPPPQVDDIEKAEHLFEVDSDSDVEIEYELVDFDEEYNKLDNFHKEVTKIIDNIKNKFEREKQDVLADYNVDGKVVKYYYARLKELYENANNEYTNFINNYYNSLDDEDKKKFNDVINKYASELFSNVNSELKFINQKFSLGDTISDPQIGTIGDTSKSVAKVLDDSLNLDITTQYNKTKQGSDFILGKTKNLVKLLSDVSKHKSEVDTLINKINNSGTIKNITENLLKFKKDYFSIIPDSKVMKFTQHELFTKNLRDYIDILKTVVEKVDKIKGATFNIDTPSKYVNNLISGILHFDGDTTQIKNSLNSLISKYKSLSSVSDKKSFFNLVDGIYKVAHTINNSHLPILSSQLKGYSDNLTQIIDIIIGVLGCFLGNNYNTHNYIPTSGSCNLFSLPSLLAQFLLFFSLDIKLPKELMDLINCLRSALPEFDEFMDKIEQKYDELIFGALQNLRYRIDALRSFLFGKYYKFMSNAIFKLNSLFCMMMKIENGIVKSLANNFLVPFNKKVKGTEQAIEKLTKLNPPGMNDFISTVKNKISLFTDKIQQVRGTKFMKDLKFSIGKAKVRFKVGAATS